MHPKSGARALLALVLVTYIVLLPACTRNNAPKFPIVSEPWCPPTPASFPGADTAPRGVNPHLAPLTTLPAYTGNEQLYATQMLCLLNNFTHGLPQELRDSLPLLEASQETTCASTGNKPFDVVVFNYCPALGYFVFGQRGITPGWGQHDRTKEVYERLGQIRMARDRAYVFAGYLAHRTLPGGVSDPAEFAAQLACMAAYIAKGLILSHVIPAPYEQALFGVRTQKAYQDAMNGKTCIGM